jgi:hypothetical protein
VCRRCGLLECTQPRNNTTQTPTTSSWSAHFPSASKVPPGISRTRRQPQHGAPSRAKSCRGSQSMSPSCTVVWKTVREPLRPAGRAAPACPTRCAVHGIPPCACPSGRLRARLPCAHCTVTPDTDEELRAVCSEARQRRLTMRARF